MIQYEIEVPRRRKRLPQMSKRNRNLVNRSPKSEFQHWAPLWDLRQLQKAAHAKRA